MSNTKLDKLSPEQEALIPVVRDEWLNRALDCPKLDHEACKEGVEWLYKLTNLAVPEIVMLPSPLACQREANRLNSPDLTVPKELKFYSFAWIGWGDYGWVSFYDYFSRIGIVQFPELDAYIKLLKSGVYDMILFDTHALISASPTFINRDTEGRLHSVAGPAIGWSDGFECYFISGVRFNHELWQKIISRALTAKEILSLSNMEQRMIALKLKGLENVLSELKAETISKTERNELLRVDEVFGEEPAYFLRYTCPSTGRVYLKGVDPEWVESNDDKIAATNLADVLQAKSHHMTLPDYLSMVSAGNES